MATTTAPPHVALFPGAGMGHLLPFLRLAAMLDSRGCAVTFITIQPTVSAAESEHLTSFFAIHPQINRHEFPLLPYQSSGLTNPDPFWIQMESITNSVHLLHPLLSSASPPISAIFSDYALINRVIDLASPFSISVYSVFTSSARFLSILPHIPKLVQHAQNSKSDLIEIPGLGQIAISTVPPQMIDPTHFFNSLISSNVPSLFKVKGVIMNTFGWFESEAIEALKRSGIGHTLPVGPLEPIQTEKAHHLPWLDNQAPESVLYISFGSRTALYKDQIRELACALERSGCRFVWALKGGKVDREDKEEVEEIVGASFLEKTREKGVIVKGWVNQEQILAHPAIGGFVSHCGWNSVMEAARFGVPILAWPQHGDQKVNAEVVQNAGLGVCVREWGWGQTKLINQDEIAEKLIELMKNEKMRERAKEVRQKAREATSESLILQKLIESFKVNQ